MNQTTQRLIYWTPRALGIAFVAFISMFAMDVLTMPLDLGHKVLALAMHLIPTTIVLIVLLVVWRWEWIGAVLFPLLAVFHLASKWGRLDWTGYAVIDGPLVLLGILFGISWRSRARPARLTPVAPGPPASAPPGR